MVLQRENEKKELQSLGTQESNKKDIEQEAARTPKENSKKLFLKKTKHLKSTQRTHLLAKIEKKGYNLGSRLREHVIWDLT